MIKVTYYRRRYLKVTIEGHAMSAEPGQDLVCASASILAYTLAANVTNMKAVGHLKNVTVRLDNGDAEIRCTPKRRICAATTMIYDSICAGFELLSKQYPQFITYEIK